MNKLWEESTTNCSLSEETDKTDIAEVNGASLSTACGNFELCDLTEFKFHAQSGVSSAIDIAPTTTDLRTQNLKFADQMTAYKYDNSAYNDPTTRIVKGDDVGLSEFCMRPVKIYEEQWGTGINLSANFNPWQLFLLNRRVANRISNYNLMSGRLHVKFVINGNGFQYGRTMVSYQPLATFDQLAANAATLVPQDFVQASQLPKIFLDPTKSTGGEMVLPFFYFSNTLNLSAGTFNNMGELQLRTINELKHANGAADKATISCFAWMEDCYLAVPTSQNLAGLLAQSGRESEIDEANRTGVISGPASTVSKIAHKLEHIPPIAPYMRATAATADTIGGVAKALGYSRPPVTRNPEPFRPTVTSSFATCTTPDTALKLTVDDKQELTIDPRTVGLNENDTLDIKEIAKRESYLTTFAWTTATDPEQLLWNCRVSPVLWAESGTGAKVFHFPACAFAALPFKYWTGSMKFRFQIVCSTFHKGRLRFVYEPNFLGATPEYNVNYTEIVDIADKQDFTLTVGPGQRRTLMSHLYPGIDPVTQAYSSTRYTTNADSENNGVFSVYVVNELTTPNSEVNNNIEVNVYVSADDDFEVFVPDNHFQHFCVNVSPTSQPQYGFEVQSGNEIVPESQNTEESDAPEQALSSSVGPGILEHDMVNMIFTGESIKSFRQLLKRYNYHTRNGILGPDAFNNLVDYVLQRPVYPYLRGAVPGAINTADPDIPYNYCNTILLHWVSWAHAGWRGSIRTKIVPEIGFNGVSTVSQENFYLERVPGKKTPPTYHTSATVAITNAGPSREAWQSVLDPGNITKMNVTGVTGFAYTDTRVNQVLEFESPFYSPDRFAPTRRKNWATENWQFCEAWRYATRACALGCSSIDVFHATGEDFQLFFFLGLPRLYYEASPPNPAIEF
nr:MAG: putative structural protein [Salisharnavirus sp.]